MSSALAAKNAHLALAERLGMSQEKLDLVRQQIAPNAPDDVLELYFERCRIAGADPFSRMFYAVSRNVKNGEKWETRWNIETTIDGFRSIAESTGEYDGQDEPVFAYDKDGKIVSCKITVYRKGMTRGVTAVAFWDEYVQLTRDGRLGPMWQKMPHGQLSKCCEALALRKAFPRQLSGLYTNDEMAQAANPEKAARRHAVDAAPPADVEPAAIKGEAEVAQEAQFTELAPAPHDADPSPKSTHAQSAQSAPGAAPSSAARAQNLRARLELLTRDPRLTPSEVNTAIASVTGEPTLASIKNVGAAQRVVVNLETALTRTQEVPL